MSALHKYLTYSHTYLLYLHTIQIRQSSCTENPGTLKQHTNESRASVAKWCENKDKWVINYVCSLSKILHVTTVTSRIPSNLHKGHPWQKVRLLVSWLVCALHLREEQSLNGYSVYYVFPLKVGCVHL